MRMTLAAILVTAVLSAAPMVCGQATGSTDNSKSSGAGTEAKKAAKTTAKDTKVAAKDTEKGTKTAAKDTGKAAKKTGSEMKKGVKAMEGKKDKPASQTTTDAPKN